MAERRHYHSPLRASQTEQTRRLILDTLAEMIAEDGFEGIIINDLAKRAGIAPRTVYRHFPDRDALHDALAERMGGLFAGAMTGLAGEPEAWPELIERTYQDFDANETIATVIARLNAVRPRPSAESARRRSLFRDQIRAAYPDLEDADVEAVLAALQILGSSRTWLRLKDELDMPGARSGQIMRWLVELALQDLERRGAVPTYELDHGSTSAGS